MPEVLMTKRIKKALRRSAGRVVVVTARIQKNVLFVAFVVPQSRVVQSKPIQFLLAVFRVATM